MEMKGDISKIEEVFLPTLPSLLPPLLHTHTRA
jgi:hypothetical protein